MASPRSLAAALITATLTLASAAQAEDVAAAKAMFNVGLEHFQNGNYDKACPALRESYRLDPRIGTLFTLAECEARAGKIATAVAHYQNFLAQVAALPSGQRIKQEEREMIAKEQVDLLTPQVPALTLVLPPNAPPSTVVKRDGVQLREPTLGVALPTDPGPHIVTTYVPGGRVLEQRFTLKKGEQKRVTLEVAPSSGMSASQGPPDADALVDTDAPQPLAPVDPPPPAEDQADTPADEGPNLRRIAAYAAGGVGVAGLILGGVTGGLAMAKKGEAGDCPDFHCQTAEQADAGNAARSMAWVSTVGFGVGIAGVGAAVVLLLTEPEKPAAEAARVRPGVRPGVLGASHEGALVGIEGAW